MAMSFKSGNGRYVFAHRWATAVPVENDNYAQMCQVPGWIRDGTSLWAWLKAAVPDVVSVHTEGGWIIVVDPPSDVLGDALEPQFTLHFRRAPPGSLRDAHSVCCSAPRSSWLANMFRHAAKRATEMKGEHQTLTLQALSDPTQRSTIAFMEGSRTVELMGRPCIGDLIEFIRESTVTPSTFSFVLGPASCGKSYSVRAASLFLYMEFASSAKGRLMYINGADFCDRPAVTLIRSLALAYHDSGAALDYIRELKDDTDAYQVTSTMERVVKSDNGRRLHLLLDGGPKVSAANAKALRHIACFGAVVLCGRWEEFLEQRERQVRTLFINGAFNEVEMTNYLAFAKLDVTKESIWWETGWVPGLIANIGCQRRYRVALKTYIGHLSSQDWPRFANVIATGEDSLPEQATGLFYRGADGVVRCLSEQLRSYAAMRFMLVATLAGKKQVNQQIRLWTSGTQRVPTGVNIEQACILVARYKRPVIDYGLEGSVTIAPAVVRLFGSSLTVEMAEECTHPTLFLPFRGAENGLDCYYVADTQLAVIRFATGSQVSESPDHIRARAEALFASDGKSRAHILAWVGYCRSGCFGTQNLHAGGRTYHEVLLSFGRFNNILACIDEKLAREKCHIAA